MTRQVSGWPLRNTQYLRTKQDASGNTCVREAASRKENIVQLNGNETVMSKAAGCEEGNVWREIHGAESACEEKSSKMNNPSFRENVEKGEQLG